MKKTLTLVSLFFTFSLLSQNVLWEDVYSNYLVLGKMIANDSQDNVVTVGNGGPVTAFNDYLYVQKHTPTGTLIWKDSIATTIANNYHSSTWVGTDSNDNIIVTGYRFILSSQNEVPNAIKVLKFDPQGNLVFNKTVEGVYGSGSVSGMGKRHWAALDENNNLYVAAAGTTNTTASAGFLLLKFDVDGNLLWERVKTFTNIHALRGMHYKNGKIALIGKATVSEQTNAVAVWDENGDLLWSQDNSGSNQTWGTDIVLDANGNTYTLTQQYDNGLYGLGVHKKDIQGNTLFSEVYGFPTDMTSGRMALLPNGNLVVTGTNWTVGGNGALEVLEVSPLDGSIVFSSSQLLPEITNWVYDIKVASNASYYIAGYSNNNGGAPSHFFLYAFSTTNGFEWSALYDSQGTEARGIVMDSQDDIYAVIHNKFTVVKFDNSVDIVLGNGEANAPVTKFYPNPVSDYLYVSSPAAHGLKKITLFSLQGKKILEYERDLEVLDLTALASGTYLICIEIDNGTVYTSRVLKK
ncbi:MAG: T9SS type A sorting domain-containing protein [Flavobacteriaceae bacterium]